VSIICEAGDPGNGAAKANEATGSPRAAARQRPSYRRASRAPLPPPLPAADRADPTHSGRQSTGCESADPMRRNPALPGYRVSERLRSYDRPLSEREGEDREALAREPTQSGLNPTCSRQSYLNKMW
jgi:hypothetical protein